MQDSDTGKWVYYETRTIADIENDVNRLVEHFVAKSGRTPEQSKEEVERARKCSLAADQLSALKAQYDAKHSDYDFKMAHPLDAQMEECKIHWQDWVCLKRGENDGIVSYAKQWDESGQEMRRKLNLEYDELKDLELQINAISQGNCP